MCVYDALIREKADTRGRVDIDTWGCFGNVWCLNYDSPPVMTFPRTTGGVSDR